MFQIYKNKTSEYVLIIKTLLYLCPDQIKVGKYTFSSKQIVNKDKVCTYSINYFEKSKCIQPDLCNQFADGALTTLSLLLFVKTCLK